MKIVLVHGVFDLLHEGHLEHLEQAKKFGDYLVVSVVNDRYVTKRKQIYNEKARVRLLKSLRCVDLVMLCNGPGPERVIRHVKPDVYVRGTDYKGKRMPESDLLDDLRVKVNYTKSMPPRPTDIISTICK